MGKYKGKFEKNAGYQQQDYAEQYEERAERDGSVAVKVILIVLLIVLIMAAAVLLFANHYLNKINREEIQGDMTLTHLQVMEEEEITQEADSTEIIEQVWQDFEEVKEMPMIETGDNIVNYLLIGSDSRDMSMAGRSDAMMIVSLNKDTQKIHITSLMRACFVIYPEGLNYSDGMLNWAYSWGGTEKLIETGYPRNDFITNTTAEEADEIKRKWNIPLDKKVVFYAPTWRDTSFVASGYTFELKADFRKWKEILGDDYVVVFKPHYLIINKYEHDDSLEGFLYSIPASAEINQFYVISDMLITDYSSVFFDYSVLNRPIYFYMYDRAEYQDQMRGFYLDVDSELPGKIYTDETEMLSAIRDDDYDYSALTAFNERFNHMQDGKCTERVIDIVFEK